MPGTKAGALKAREKLLKENPNHYREIGAKGGKWRGPKGFATNPELSRIAGAKGGRISRRNRDHAKQEV